MARLIRLRAAERRTFLLAVGLLPLVRVGILACGFGRTHRSLRVLCPLRFSSVDAVDVHAAARLVRAAARHGRSGATCLPQSLVLWALLRRRGVDGVLRIGTRRVQTPPGREARPGIEAHAWVEVAGRPVDDVTPDVSVPSFVPFAPIP